MTEVGPLLELMEVREFDDQNLWTLVVDDDTVLFADFDEPLKRLALSAEVGRPPDAGRQRLYELLLQYNNQWPETGGVRMALDGPDGSVVQIFDLPVADLDTARLRTVVSNFVDTLRAWREILGKEDDGRGGEPDPGPMGGMIRA